MISLIDMNNANFGETLTDDDLLAIKDIMIQQFTLPGFKLGPASEFVFKNHRGFKSEGSGAVGEFTFKIVLKFFLFSHYIVEFQELYNDDNSIFLPIEESLRIGTEQNLSGMQTISYNGYSFVYNADKMLASIQKQEDVITFFFHFKDSNDGDTFLKINFFTKSADNLYGDALEWSNRMIDLYSKGYATFDMKPMERATFLGKSGYQRSGIGTLTVIGKKAKIVQKVCGYNGRFTTATIQQTLNNNGQVPKEVDELFKAVEESLRYSE